MEELRSKMAFVGLNENEQSQLIRMAHEYAKSRLYVSTEWAAWALFSVILMHGKDFVLQCKDADEVFMKDMAETYLQG